MQLPSIQRRIIVTSVFSLALFFLVTTSISVYFLINWLKVEYDQNLTSKASVLVTLTKDLETGLEFDFADEFMPEFERSVNPEYFQLWIEKGLKFEASNSLAGGNLPVNDFNSFESTFSDIVLPDGRDGRMIRISFYPQIVDNIRRTPANIAKLPKVTLAVAREKESLNNTISTIWLVFIFEFLFLITAISLIIWRNVSNGLRPITEIKDKLASLSAEDLSQRLKVERPTDELNTLIIQFNGLLAKLEKSFQREQRFSSDVAHELKTPISEIRNMADVAQQSRDPQPEGHGFYGDILDASIQMQFLVDNLLAQVRSEQSKTVPHLTLISLVDLFDSAWERHQRIASQRSIQLNRDIQVSEVISSRDELEPLLNNLVSNAVTYADNDSCVSLLVEKNSDGVVFCLSNLSSSLVESDLELMFDRLWQKDPSRSNTNHSGLGLSLVKTYVKNLGLKVSTSLDGNVFSVRLSGFSTCETTSSLINAPLTPP